MAGPGRGGAVSMPSSAIGLNGLPPGGKRPKSRRFAIPALSALPYQPAADDSTAFAGNAIQRSRRAVQQVRGDRPGNHPPAGRLRRRQGVAGQAAWRRRVDSALDPFGRHPRPNHSRRAPARNPPGRRSAADRTPPFLVSSVVHIRRDLPPPGSTAGRPRTGSNHATRSRPVPPPAVRPEPARSARRIAGPACATRRPSAAGA